MITGCIDGGDCKTNQYCDSVKCKCRERSCKIYVKNGYAHEVTNALIGGTAKFGCQDWKDKATHVPVVCTSNKETHATWTQLDGSELPSCATPVHQGMIIWYCLTRAIVKSHQYFRGM